MIDYEKFIDWLQERIKDESEALELLRKYPNARAMTFGTREAYFNVLLYLSDEPDIHRNQPQVDVDRCQHESNQSSLIIRCDGDIDNPFECIKCGEFY